MRKPINERVFNGQIISWINELVNAGKTKFEWATNDEGVSIECGPTVFPDILLFSDKKAALVFNGWELKFPNTEVDDEELLENALKKAKALSLANTHKAYWHIAGDSLNSALPNTYWATLGLMSLTNRYCVIRSAL